MKDYDEIKHEITKSIPFADKHVEIVNKKIAKAYAQQVAEDVRQKCYENISKLLHQRGQYINIESIKDTDVFLP